MDQPTLTMKRMVWKESCTALLADPSFAAVAPASPWKTSKRMKNQPPKPKTKPATGLMDQPTLTMKRMVWKESCTALLADPSFAAVAPASPWKTSKRMKNQPPQPKTKPATGLMACDSPRYPDASMN